MAPAIPDRWMDYKPIGERIEGTRFIAFKVPLREQITKTVDQEIRLDGKILLETVPNLGMIIDLTNTYRYYDPNVFQREGVEHKKLMIPGHITPPKHLVNRFKQFVKNFIESNLDNDKLIGVHCTHGVNRTGYLICNYMISEMTIEPNDAIRRFDKARGHKIERNNYLDALQKCLENNDETESNNDETNNERTYEPRNYQRNDHRTNNWRIREENNSYSSRTQNWRTREENNSERSRVRTDYYDTKRWAPYYRRGQSNHRVRSNHRSYSPAQESLERSSNNSIQSNEHCNSPQNNSYQPRLKVDYYNTRIISSNSRPRTAHLQRQHPYCQQNHYPQDL